MASKSIGDYEVTIKVNTEDAEKSLDGVSEAGEEAGNGISSAFGNLKSSLDGVAGAIAGLTVAFKLFQGYIELINTTTDAWIDQAVAIAKLEQGLLNVGLEGAELDSTLIGLNNQFSELQKTTGFADENIAQAATVLTTFGLAADEIQNILPSLLDVQAVVGDTNTDLTSLSNQFGKLFSDPDTFAATLSRQGVLIDTGALAELVTLEEKREFVLSEIEKNYGGIAEAIEGAKLNTNRLINAQQDLKQATGEIFAPFKSFVNLQLAKLFESLTENIREVATAVGVLSLAVGVLMSILGGPFIAIVGAAVGLIGGATLLAVRSSADAVEDFSDALNDNIEVSTKTETAQKALTAAQADATTTAEELAAAQKAVTEANLEQIQSDTELKLSLIDLNEEYEKLNTQLDKYENREEKVQERIAGFEEEKQALLDILGVSSEIEASNLNRADLEREDKKALDDLELVLIGLETQYERLNKIEGKITDNKEEQADIVDSLVDYVGDVNDKESDAIISADELTDSLSNAVLEAQELKEELEAAADAFPGDIDADQQYIDNILNRIDRINEQIEAGAINVAQSIGSIFISENYLDETQRIIDSLNEGAEFTGEALEANIGLLEKQLYLFELMVENGEELTDSQQESYNLLLDFYATSQDVLDNQIEIENSTEKISKNWKKTKKEMADSEITLQEIGASLVDSANEITEILTTLDLIDDETATLLNDMVELGESVAKVIANPADAAAWIAAAIDLTKVLIDLFDKYEKKLDDINETADEAIEAAGDNLQAQKQAYENQLESLRELLAETKNKNRQDEINADIQEASANLAETELEIQEEINKAIEKREQLEKNVKDLRLENLDLQIQLAESLGLDTVQLEQEKLNILEAQQAEQQAIVDSIQSQIDYYELVADLNADLVNQGILLLPDMLALEEDLLEANNALLLTQLDIADLTEEGISLEEERNDIIKERLNLLNEAVDLGVIDTENIFQQLQLEKELKNIGQSDIDIANTLSGLGFQGRNVNIGSINTNVTTNNPDVVNNNVEESIINTL